MALAEGVGPSLPGSQPGGLSISLCEYIIKWYGRNGHYPTLAIKDTCAPNPLQVPRLDAQLLVFLAYSRWCLAWDSNPENLGFEPSTYTNSISQTYWYCPKESNFVYCFIRTALNTVEDRQHKKHWAHIGLPVHQGLLLPRSVLMSGAYFPQRSTTSARSGSTTGVPSVSFISTASMRWVDNCSLSRRFLIIAVAQCGLVQDILPVATINSYGPFLYRLEQKFILLVEADRIELSLTPYQRVFLPLKDASIWWERRESNPRSHWHMIYSHARYLLRFTRPFKYGAPERT